MSSPPLSALANSVTANGVYSYSATSVLPASTYRATNYWVDVDFEPSQGTVPGQVMNISASAGTGSAAVSWPAPSSGGRPITKYAVTPYVGSKAQPATTVTGSPPATSAVITALTYTGAITGSAGETVTLNDPAPTNDEWNMAAIEILGDGPANDRSPTSAG